MVDIYTVMVEVGRSSAGDERIDLSVFARGGRSWKCTKVGASQSETGDIVSSSTLTHFLVQPRKNYPTPRDSAFQVAETHV